MPEEEVVLWRALVLPYDYVSTYVELLEKASKIAGLPEMTLRIARPND